jgi:Cu(I)/Ag(I) efflux system membrane fusion protein/cobalt-zinc-cadmium efflux system membrane fusion protein
MRRLFKLTFLVIAFVGMISVLEALRFSTQTGVADIVLQSLGINEALAAQKDLKAGMIDPETGKKIKYWTSPMDPTYIRNEPGKSPMGMDLVPVYEEEGEEKEPTSTIRIDPVTMQNMVAG